MIGAYAVVIFLEATRFATEWLPALQPVQIAALREILVGLALILVLHLRPQGLLPERIPRRRPQLPPPPEPKSLAMSDDLAELSRLLAEPGQPETVFRAFDAAAKRLVGHELFTLLYVDGQEVARIYSNRPAEYPVSGRKPMGPTPWGEHVLKGRKSYLGRDKAGDPLGVLRSRVDRKHGARLRH